MDSLLPHLYSPYYLSEVAAAVTATVFFYKYKNSPIWLIMPILWMAVIAETSGVLYVEFVYPNNNWIFNIYGLLFYAVFYKMVYNFVKDPMRRKIIIILSVAVLVVYIINALVTDPLYAALTYGKIAGTVVMVVHLMYAAIESLKSARVFDLKESLPIVVFAGYLLIELTLIPVSLIRNMDLHIWSLDVYNGVNTILGVVLIIANSIFIIGFIWTKPSSHKGITS